MQGVQGGVAELAALEAQAARAMQSGRAAEAARAWNRMLEIEPANRRALAALGEYHFRSGDLVAARPMLQRLADADGSDPQQWVNLALACQGLKDEAAEEAAIRQALTVDPSDLLALLLRGGLAERQGRRHDAARAYGAAATVAPPADRLHPDLRPSVARAAAYKARYDRECAEFLDGYLAPHLAAHAGAGLGRFRESVDIMVGRKRRFDSQSAVYHYPQLAPIPFWERAQFPWLDAFEASTAEMRAEFLAAFEADAGFTPYIEYPPDVPHNQWAELNHSPRWSAMHLFKMGRRVDANADRCPRTMALLATAPQPDQPGRTPAAMFSLLRPRTRIPPHCGVTNARLVVHVPLVVPGGCGFRVGNETRQWVPGQAFVFDDTIEHEAWNDSDEPRAVLIFDIWHPHLSLAERALVTAMTEGLAAFTGGTGGYEL